MPLKLLYITNNTDIADIADRTGVDRIWIDLEKNGKEDRQKGMNTVKSNHELNDIRNVRPFCRNAKLLVRINPINRDSKYEIDKAIEYGADIIMLPYYKTLDEVITFFKFIDHRVKTILLLETKEAVDIIDSVLELPDVEEIHIGLNDLHISYGLSFMFELLCNGCVDNLANKIKEKGIPFGVGGIAKLGEGLLPAEYVVAEHYRLGSQAAILSRSFYDSVDDRDYATIENFFRESINELRKYEEYILKQGKLFFDKNHKKVEEIVNNIAMKKEGKKNENYL